MRLRRSMIVALSCGVVSCAGEPDVRPQWLVTVSSDAVVPRLVDRLRVEVLDETGALACSACRRDFALDASSALPLSFGVVAPDDDASWTIHAVLHRADRTAFDGEPFAETAVHARGRLPRANGVTAVSLRLPMDCIGVGDAMGMRCDPGSRTLIAADELDDDPPLVTGSWAPAQPQPCALDVPEGMVCIDGGLFVRGTRTFIPTSFETAPVPEQLVRLSPFAIDVDEVTVGQARPHAATVGLGELPNNPECTFRADGSQDDHPLNCVTWLMADALCGAMDKRLPTEAEWEWVAGNGVAETRFPWGDDDLVADHAVVTGPAPLPGGSDRDVTTTGVRNLGGNLIELIGEAFYPYGDPCHEPAAFLDDPRCVASHPDYDGWALQRGGAYSLGGLTSGAAIRNVAPTGIGTRSIGFRCVVDAP